MSSDNQALDRLILRTHSASLTPDMWSKMGPEIADCFASSSAVVRRALPDPTQGLIVATENLRLGVGQADLARHWFANDVWAQRAAGAKLGQVVRSEDLIDDRSLIRTGFYQDWLRHLDIHHCMGCVIDLPDLGQLVIGIHRSVGARPFSAADCRQLSIWLGHLRQALEIQAALGLNTQCLQTQEQLLATCTDALYIVDAGLRVFYVNSSAEAIVRLNGSFQLQQGRLSVRPAVLQQQLSQVVVQLTKGQGQAVRLRFLNQPIGSKTVISVTPFQQQPLLDSLDQSALVLIRLRELKQRSINPDHLQQLFGLTIAESNVVARLTEGHCIEEIAAAQQVKPNTVAAHIKKAMSKTDTHRQAELVALVCRACLAL